MIKTLALAFALSTFPASHAQIIQPINQPPTPPPGQVNPTGTSSCTRVESGVPITIEYRAKYPDNVEITGFGAFELGLTDQPGPNFHWIGLSQRGVQRVGPNLFHITLVGTFQNVPKGNYRLQSIYTYATFADPSIVPEAAGPPLSELDKQFCLNVVSVTPGPKTVKPEAPELRVIPQ